MNHRLLIALFSLQVVLVYFAYPNSLMPQPSWLSVGAIILALMPLFFIAIRYQKKRAFILGGCAGSLLLIIPSLMITQGVQHPLYNWFVWLMVAIFSFFFYGTLVSLLSYINRINRSLFILSGPILFTAFESVRLFAAAFWNLTSLSHLSPTLALAGWSPLVQMVSITGTPGPILLISLVSAWMVFFLYERILTSDQGRTWLHIRLKVHPLSVKKYYKSMIGAGLLGAIMMLFFIWGNIEASQISTLQSEEEMTIRPALVQTNFDVGNEPTWNRHIEYRAIRIVRELAFDAAKQEADFLQFSENAIPGYLPASAKLWTDLQSILKEVNLPAIIGIWSILDSEKQFNSWFFLDSQGVLDNYYIKRHLVPVKDYLPMTSVIKIIENLSNKAINVPLLFAPPALRNNLAHSTVAGQQERPFNIYGSKIVVKVDEEILNGHHIREAIKQGGELIMVPASIHHHKNKTNYFLTLLMARICAIETRRWIGWVASMGGAAYIDALGNVRAQSSYNQKQILVQDVPLLTFKSVYIKVGDLFSLIICLIAIALIILISYQNHNRG